MAIDFENVLPHERPSAQDIGMLVYNEWHGDQYRFRIRRYHTREDRDVLDAAYHGGLYTFYVDECVVVPG